MRSRRQVEDLLGEGLGDVGQDVQLADDPDQPPVIVDDRHVAVDARGHQGDRLVDRLVDPERLRLAIHHRFDWSAQVHRLAQQVGHDVALGEHPGQPSLAVGHQNRIAHPGALDQAQALGQRGPRWDRQGSPALDDAERLAGECGHPLGNGAFGRFGHPSSVVRSGPGAGPAPGRASAGEWAPASSA